MRPIDYMSMNPLEKFIYKLKTGIKNTPKKIASGCKKCVAGVVKGAKTLWADLKELGITFVEGSIMTKISFLIMGLGQLSRKQIARGLSFLGLQIAYIVYMIMVGIPNLSMFTTLGEQESGYNDLGLMVEGDNSFFILLYSLFSILLTAGIIFMWRLSQRDNRRCEQLLRAGKRLPTNREDLHSLLDKHFDKTLLALPVSGVVIFTALPIIFMICVAFTNYDVNHSSPNNLFTWVGLENFEKLFETGHPKLYAIDVNGERVEGATADALKYNPKKGIKASTYKLDKAGTYRFKATAGINIYYIEIDGQGVIFDASTMTLGDIKENTEIGNLILGASETKPLTVVKEEAVSVDGKEFTQCLKLNGVSGTKERLLKLKVDGPTEVTIYMVSGEIKTSATFGSTFLTVLSWTLIWAFFATFLNYFLGMGVAMLINRKGIKFKKMWRTILVVTIAVPQFVSLLYVSKLFGADGIINIYWDKLLAGANGLLYGDWAGLQDMVPWFYSWFENFCVEMKDLPFWDDPIWARVTIICVNLWIGIPYLMLIATGLLMNIPEDLYESARIDGASAWQMFRKITLPYMLFVTGPYLLTSFTGNLNNFNVIFLLTQGNPGSFDKLSDNAGYTDLLITWLYDMTVNYQNYRMAAVIGILVFVVTAVISLIVYGLLPSVRDEEGFQ